MIFINWVFVFPPKFICWNTNPQCDWVTRIWGLWEVGNLGHEGRALLIHRSARLIETRELFAPFYATRGSQLSPTQKKALSRTQACWHLVLKLQDSKIIINKFPLFISHLVCGPLLWTKTMTLVNTTTGLKRKVLSVSGLSNLQCQIKVSENSSFFLKAQILFAIILQVFLKVIGLHCSFLRKCLLNIQTWTAIVCLSVVLVIKNIYIHTYLHIYIYEGLITEKICQLYILSKT